MATIIPRPDVTAETSNGKVDVVISREGRAKSYTGEGGSEATRTADVVRKIINDGHTAEWLLGRNER